MKLKVITILVISLILVTFVACGGKQAANVSQDAIREERKYSDVLSCEWKLLPAEPKEAKGYEVAEYIPDALILNDKAFGWMKDYISMYGDELYTAIWCAREVEDGYESGFELSHLDMKTGSKETAWLSFSKMNAADVMEQSLANELDEKVYDGNAVIASIDACEDGVVLFLITTDDEQVGEHFYRIELATDYTIRRYLDITDNIWRKQKPLIENIDVIKASSGPDGDTYLADSDNGKIFLIDSGGNTVKTENVDNARLFYTECIGKSIDGMPIFLSRPEVGRAEFFYFGNSGKKVLYSGNYEAINNTIDSFGNVIMADGGSLIEWNVLTGERKQLCKLDGLGAYTCQGISRNKSGDISICYKGSTDSFVYRINDEPHPDIKELKILIRGENSLVKDGAADYSRTHPGVKITVEEMSDANNNYEWMKLAEEIKDGAGPDMILGTRKQLSVLKEAGIICTIDDLLSDEVKENVFKGVLEYGKFDSKLYALPIEAGLRVIYIPKTRDVGGAWTSEEVMTLYEEWNKSSSDSKKFWLADSYIPWPNQLLYFMCGWEIDHSNFLNIDEMTCNFETEDFYRLLKFCKDNTTDASAKETLSYPHFEDIIEMVKNEDFFIYEGSGNLVTYSETRQVLGENYVTVGFPSETGSHSIIGCYEAVAISELSDKKEIAADFLQYLVGEECEVKYTTRWIRKDVLRVHVKNASELNIWTKDGKQHPAFMAEADATNGSHIPLGERPDGTSFVDEYIELMDNGTPETIEYDIWNIVYEETAPFFEGQKTAQEVARIIQSRVQIYLEEKK